LQEWAELGFAIVIAVLAILGRIYVADFLVAVHVSGGSLERTGKPESGFLASALIVGSWVILWAGYLILCVKIYRGSGGDESSGNSRSRLVLGSCALIVGIVLLADILVIGATAT